MRIPELTRGRNRQMPDWAIRRSVSSGHRNMRADETNLVILPYLCTGIFCGSDYQSTRSPDPPISSAFQEVHERIYDLGACVIRQAHGLALHVTHEAVQVVARIGDADHAKSAALP